MNNLRNTADRLAAKRGKDEGFTLIELLVVIVILGILAAVVVFAVGGITDRGGKAACKANVKTLEVAVEAYRAQQGSYPVDEAGLSVLKPGFIREIPPAADFDYAVVAGLGTVTPTGACVAP